ncbi:methionine ABC transporter permease [Haloplasma contractile]|uniref:ABC transporter permease protein n=1 Tax=Haloplasma contractile SSD-17B TaxID=1033810 RepID=F7PVW6_9MOLU|nr:ABC transporter permease subunit [Haloplasma contractile]ERJ12711.1 ABC transporter permease protein [Haloplasma contractile SSD-17B]
MNKYIETFKLFKSDILNALFETLNMLFTAMIVTLIVGILIGFILFITRPGGLYKNKIIYFISSGLINITRSIPYILFIIVIIPFNRLILGTGFGVNASKIPLSLIGIAIFARFTEQALLDVNKSTYETAYALGANTRQYFTHFLLKEARSGLILSFAHTSISLLAYSTVMGIIGGGGLGYLAMSEGYYNFNYPLMWIIIIIMILIVQIIQTTGNIIAKKIDKR